MFCILKLLVNSMNLPKICCSSITGSLLDYSGLLGATCPDFESHHSGEWEPLIPEFQSHYDGLYTVSGTRKRDYFQRRSPL